MGRIRVMHLVRQVEGGMKTHLVGLLHSLAPSEFETIVAGPLDSTLAQQLKQHDCSTRSIPLPDGLQAKSMFIAITKTVQILKEFRPAIVHAHGATASIIASFALTVASIKPKPALVITIHGTPRLLLTKSYPGKLVLRWLLASAISNAQMVISVSQETAAAVRISTQNPNVRVIPNTVDISKFSHVRHRILTGPKLTIGSAGRLAAEKGFEVLINAMDQIVKAVPQAELLIAGKGPLEAKLADLINQLNLNSHIQLIGYLPDIRELLQVIDVFVLPSLSEGVSLALLEAMASALPVIGTNAGGTPEVIIHGQNGLLVSPGDPQALADAITWLFNNPDFARRMGEEAAKTISQNFNAQKNLAKMSQLYRGLIAGNNLKETLKI